MSVIIRLQNLPWSANALDIRTFFRGLSIPEGGVHIVGGELGDAFIAFSTDEDARQAMMLDGGKVKEIQVKLLLSSRSEMHKVIEAARQNVPILSLTTPAPAPAPAPPPTPAPPVINPFTAALGGSGISGFGIPGLGNPLEIPQPAVIEPPAPLSLSPPIITTPADPVSEKQESEERKRRDRRRSRTRSRSRSRDRERKDRKRDRRDRSRSRERRRRSRSRDRRDRKRRSRSRSPSRSSPRTRGPAQPAAPPVTTPNNIDPYSRLHEISNKRNPNAFQPAEHNGNGSPAPPATVVPRRSRFEPERGCCVAIRNAPNHTSYGDVRRFFPFMIDKHGIKMINDPLGRRTGNIFVRFCEVRSKQLTLQRRSNELKGQEVVVEHLDDETYDTAVDSFLPYREENEHVIESAPAPNPVQMAPFTVLKLTDLPHYVKEHDIIKALSDFSLLAITLKDERGTRTRYAYVQFAAAEDARAAYDLRERLVFGRRQAGVSVAAPDEYERERERAPVEMSGPRDPRQRRDPPAPPDPRPDPPPDPRQRRELLPDPRQRLDQLPDPRPRLDQLPDSRSRLDQLPDPRQRFDQIPEPRARFDQLPDPRQRLNQTQDPRQRFDQQPDLRQRKEVPAAPVNPPTLPPVISIEDEPLDCVLMKGLPRDATDRTIVEFLAETGAVPARIHLMLDHGGLPSGDCFCEFRSASEARLASTKHASLLAGQRVSVDLVPRGLVEDALEGPRPAAHLLPPDAPLPHFMPPPFDMPQPDMFVQPPNDFSPPQEDSYPVRGGYRGRGNFNRNNNSFNGSNGFDNGYRGRGRGGFDRGGRGFNPRGRAGRGGGGFEPRGRGRGRGRGGGGGSSFHDTNRFDPVPEADAAGLEDFGAPGCVVTLENVPFRATVDDIMQFFSEFELTEEDVIRRFNERGQATGDARVAFRTPFDAQRAVKTHHLEMILDRRISLNIL